MTRSTSASHAVPVADVAGDRAAFDGRVARATSSARASQSSSLRLAMATSAPRSAKARDDLAPEAAAAAGDERPVAGEVEQGSAVTNDLGGWLREELAGPCSPSR